MSLPKIYILNDTVELVARGYVSETFTISSLKSFNIGKLIDNELTFTVKNNQYEFCEDHSQSILNGVNWRQSVVKVYNSNDVLIWQGLLEDIRPDFKGHATIIARSIISQMLEQPIAYESSTWETAGDAIYNIFSDYSFTNYNSAALQKTINDLTNNECYLSCNINKSDNLSLQGAIEKLAEYGCCNLYGYKNEIYVKHWLESQSNIYTSLGHKDLQGEPEIYTLMTDVINDYSIDHYESNGVPETDIGNNNIMAKSRELYGTRQLQPFDSGIGKQIVLKDATSAIYIGEQFYKRTHINPIDNTKICKPVRQIKFPIKLLENDWVDMQAKFTLTFSDMAWTNKLLEIYGIDYRESDNIIYITANEVTE